MRLWIKTPFSTPTACLCRCAFDRQLELGFFPGLHDLGRQVRKLNRRGLIGDFLVLLIQLYRMRLDLHSIPLLLQLV
jgi:hypothetical protein